jgi:hypothetical protein
MDLPYVNPSDFRFLYRDPSNFYNASNQIAFEEVKLVRVEDGDAYLLALGRKLDEVGYGFVVMPSFDLATSAYERALNLCDLEDDDEIEEEILGINATIAMMLGYRVQRPTNYVYETITTDRFASPYERHDTPSKFNEMPDYVGTLSDALLVAPKTCDLALIQNNEEWTATYIDRETGKRAAHTGDQVISIALSALLMRRVTLT